MTGPTSLLDTLLADLAAEGDRLDGVVAGLDETGWHTPTPAPGWDVATQVGHLAWTDHVAALAATDTDGWDAAVAAALGDPDGYVDACAEEWGAGDPAALLERWRAGRTTLAGALRGVPDGTRLPWFGPPMSPASMATARFMETWAHALDVTDALGVAHEPTDRVRHVAHLGVRTRDFAFLTRGETPPADPFSVTLVAPSEDVWTWGPPDAAQTVTGAAYDFCLLVTQRRHRDDLALEAHGADAEHWLEIAQAFAGPPGAGRAPA